MPALVVLGAANLGGAILDRFIADGWSAAAVARREETLAAISCRGALALEADAQDPQQLARALARAREELGSLDLIVNAVSTSSASMRPGEPFGGGPLADASLDAYRRWVQPTSQTAFVFLSEGARALRGAGGGTLVQITNSTSRRPQPGSGAWSAAHHAVRALTLAAAEELRREGIRVCLLIADGPIDSPKNAARLAAEGIPREATLDQAQIAAALAGLVAQGDRAFSYELAVSAR